MPRYRPSARILLVDLDSHVLLFHFHLGDGRRFWATPGGGLEGDEDFRQAAARELLEETGLDLAMSDDPVLERRFEMAMPDGEWVEAHEQFFVIRHPRPELARDGWTDLEKSMMTAHRWWTVSELVATTETVYPQDLADILTRLEP